jgi:drug/metabolite transporter (DMT)-like permease
MTWQFYTIISVLALSSSVLFQKILLSKFKSDPYAYAVVFQGLVGVLLMCFALLVGFKLPGIEKVMVPAIISIVAFGLGHIIYAKTLQVVEASAFSVLFATQAIWIMLLGILLFNESLTILQIIGAIVIFCSVGLLVKNIKALKLDRGTLLGLLTGLLFGIAITAWSYVGRHTDGISWAAISFVGTSLVAFLARPQSAKHMGMLFKSKVLLSLGVLTVFYAIGSLTMLYAYKEGTFSVVTPLRQSSIIITTLLALLFISAERNRIRRKLIAAALCFIGVLLIIL